MQFKDVLYNNNLLNKHYFRSSQVITKIKNTSLAHIKTNKQEPAEGAVELVLCDVTLVVEPSLAAVGVLLL